MKRVYYIIRCLSVVCLLQTSTLQAQSSEAIYYSIDPDDAYAPVTKQSAEKPGTTYMRDPNFHQGSPAIAAEKAKKPRSNKRQLTYTAKNHQFRPAKITGKLRTPRVTFMQEPIGLSKIPDELPRAFLDKAFDADATAY